METNSVFQVPQVLREETVTEDKYGRIVINRFYDDYPNDPFMMWGGKTVPAIVLPVTTDGRVIALRMFRRAANKIILEIPGGNPHGKETIEDYVRRELREETGHSAEEIIQLGPATWFDPCSCTTPYLPFLALGCQKVQEPKFDKLEATDIKEIVLVWLSEWIKMTILSKDFDDSKTITVTHRALPYLGVKLSLNGIPLL